MSSDAVVERLQRLLVHAPGSTIEPGRLELDPPPGGLPTWVRWTDREIAVTLCPAAAERGAWHHAWSLAGDDDDAWSELLDLVAVVAFGRARVVVHLRASTPVRWDTEFLVDDAWVLHASSRAGRWRPLMGRRTKEIAINHIRVPDDVTLARAGSLPFAPWVGTIATAPSSAPAALAVDGVLDLHPFSPKEVKPLVLAYIDACLDAGITELRIIHGKGIGNLRRTVHALLEKHPDVSDFRLGGHGEGSWGATIVDLRRRETP